jgi:hypothetical protein
LRGERKVNFPGGKKASSNVHFSIKVGAHVLSFTGPRCAMTNQFDCQSANSRIIGVGFFFTTTEEKVYSLLLM